MISNLLKFLLIQLIIWQSIHCTCILFSFVQCKQSYVLGETTTSEHRICIDRCFFFLNANLMNGNCYMWAVVWFFFFMEMSHYNNNNWCVSTNTQRSWRLLYSANTDILPLLCDSILCCLFMCVRVYVRTLYVHEIGWLFWDIGNNWMDFCMIQD